MIEVQTDAWRLVLIPEPKKGCGVSVCLGLEDQPPPKYYMKLGRVTNRDGKPTLIAYAGVEGIGDPVVEMK